MRYPELQLHILEIFVEAQAEATKRRIAYATMIWGEAYRSGRFTFPANETEIGQLPAVVSCVTCRRAMTSLDPKVLRGHQQSCGKPPPRRPQYRPIVAARLRTRVLNSEASPVYDEIPSDGRLAR